MENEFQILSNLLRNDNATQRELAKNTGLSLGNVNILIKRLVKKGLLKIERLNPKTIRYILTQQGMKEKARATYNYISSSYKYINLLNSEIDSLIKCRLLKEAVEVILFGSQDEIYNLLSIKLEQSKIPCRSIENIVELENEINLVKEDEINVNIKFLVLIWHPEFESFLEEKTVPYVNLLDRL